MSKLKEIYNKVIFYTASYGELLFWTVLIVFTLSLFFGRP